MNWKLMKMTKSDHEDVRSRKCEIAQWTYDKTKIDKQKLQLPAWLRKQQKNL